MTVLNPEQLFRELNDIKELISGVNTRLDTANGRTRTLEVKVALLWAVMIVAGSAIVAAIPVLLGWL